MESFIPLFILFAVCVNRKDLGEGMGIAKELLSKVVEEARTIGCGTVQITASDMGVKLYTAFGFKHNGNFMHYKL